MSTSGIASFDEVDILNRRVKRLEKQVLELSRGGTVSAHGATTAIR